jgi:hypothetical protein
MINKGEAAQPSSITGLAKQMLQLHQYNFQVCSITTANRCLQAKTCTVNKEKRLPCGCAEPHRSGDPPPSRAPPRPLSSPRRCQRRRRAKPGGRGGGGAPRSRFSWDFGGGARSAVPGGAATWRGGGGRRRRGCVGARPWLSAARSWRGCRSGALAGSFWARDGPSGLRLSRVAARAGGSRCRAVGSRRRRRGCGAPGEWWRRSAAGLWRGSAAPAGVGGELWVCCGRPHLALPLGMDDATTSRRWQAGAAAPGTRW